jgi:hypothetical protein
MSEHKRHSRIDWIQVPTGSAQKKAGLESAMCYGGHSCIVMSQNRAQAEIDAEFNGLLRRAEQQIRAAQ